MVKMVFRPHIIQTQILILWSRRTHLNCHLIMLFPLSVLCLERPENWAFLLSHVDASEPSSNAFIETLVEVKKTVLLELYLIKTWERLLIWVLAALKCDHISLSLQDSKNKKKIHLQSEHWTISLSFNLYSVSDFYSSYWLSNDVIRNPHSTSVNINETSWSLAWLIESQVNGFSIFGIITN